MKEHKSTVYSEPQKDFNLSVFAWEGCLNDEDKLEIDSIAKQYGIKFEQVGSENAGPRFYNAIPDWISIFADPNVVNTILLNLSTDIMYDGLKMVLLKIVDKLLAKKRTMVSSNGKGELNKEETGTALELKKDGVSVYLKFDHPLTPVELEAYFVVFRNLERQLKNDSVSPKKDWVIFQDKHGKINFQKMISYLMAQSKKNSSE